MFAFWWLSSVAERDGRTCPKPREDPNAGVLGHSQITAASLTQILLMAAGQKDEAANEPSIGPATTRRA